MHHLHFFNHWAILASAVILWLLGAVWYSPALFAKPWMAMVHVDPAQKNSKSMMIGMISSFVLDIVLAFVLDHVIQWSGADTFGMGALVGFIMWLGFIAAPALPQGIYESRPFKLFAINTGYMLVGLMIIGGVLAVWK
jgi:hypothetical protein